MSRLPTYRRDILSLFKRDLSYLEITIADLYTTTVSYAALYDQS